MPFVANVLKVMIASPSDVPAERQAIREILAEWNHVHAEDRKLVLLPIGWETHSTPALGDRPQAIINKQVLADCDLLVAVFWTRLGSPTGKAASGTVEEIEEHRAAGKPVMLYFSNAPVRPDSVNEKQYRALTEFKKQCYSRGLVESYDSVEEFRDKFARQLAQTMIRDFGSAGGSAPSPPAEAARPLIDRLSADARELLVNAARNDGQIIIVTTSGGTSVETGRHTLLDMGTPKEAARWGAAIDELVDHGLAVDASGGGGIFNLHHRGYQLAEEIERTGLLPGPRVNP